MVEARVYEDGEKTRRWGALWLTLSESPMRRFMKRSELRGKRAETSDGL